MNKMIYEFDGSHIQNSGEIKELREPDFKKKKKRNNIKGFFFFTS